MGLWLGITGWSQSFYLPSWSLPWIPESIHLLLRPQHSRDNFTATYHLLNCNGVFGILQSPLPEYKIAPSCHFLCVFTSEAPGSSSQRGMKEELGFPTGHSQCSRGQGGVGNNSERIWIWEDSGGKGKKYSLLYLASQINGLCVERTARCRIECLPSSGCSGPVLKINISHYFLSYCFGSWKCLSLLVDWRGLIRLNGAEQECSENIPCKVK